MKQELERKKPEDWLEQIAREKKGELTVFLGASAGVGKTYAMLETAHERLLEGQNVIVGWIETHGRKETEKLAAGIPKTEPKKIVYREREWLEMDVDAIVALHPDIVLVDELAHTNIPGSRYVRRFQDVEELLAAGIDVYTTLNIQHIESLNDVVAKITGVVVRETVPDSIVEQAAVVELIDLPPEKLLKRLHEGKVYVAEQAQQAVRKFFRPGNLNALRELALRYTARRVDQDLSAYMRAHGIPGPWPAADRVMVCVSASPFSAELVRAAKRLADGLQAEWLAVYVESSSQRAALGDEESARVSRNLKLAEELGAKIITVVSSEPAEEILSLAKNHNITAIVVGKTRKTAWWQRWQGSIVDEILRGSAGFSVHVIQAEDEKVKVPVIAIKHPLTPFAWQEHGKAISLVALVTAALWLLREQIDAASIVLIYQLPTLLSAFWWGRWEAYSSAVASVLVFDYLFVEPVFTFAVSDIKHLWSFLAFWGLAVVIGRRTERMRLDLKLSRQREKSTRFLYEFSSEMAGTVEKNVVAERLSLQVAETLGRETLVFLSVKERLELWARHSGERSRPGLNLNPPEAAEMAVANWCFEHGQAAGRATEILPSAAYLHVPLRSQERVMGVFSVRLNESKVTQEERRLIDAWAALAALTLERASLAEEARKAALWSESDRLRTALFNSVSHELRTPLTSILGAIQTLLLCRDRCDEGQLQEMLQAISEGAMRMERVVSNLLDTARLESGMMQLKADWCDVEDILGVVLRRMEGAVHSREILVKMEPGLPMLWGDCVLLEQVMVNLLDNACKYSPVDTPIEICVSKEADEVKLEVLDRGTGMAQEELELVFEKFYRASRTHASKPGGTGLGLSICKGIVEAHHGRIEAVNREAGGAIFRVYLPVKKEEEAVSL